jgi:ABC-type nitrate/sulfonate/bicarbonate transport system ATPase subunit/ABC-type nitrate/sulfonate/bicarbonate transport system permease component
MAMRVEGATRWSLPTARVGGYLLPLVLWWIAARATGVGLALPSPEVVILATAREFLAAGFAAEVLATVVRAVAAIVVSAVIGVPLGMAAARSESVNALTRPLVVAVRATPFISVILVAVIWFAAGTVPVFVAVLMAVPIVVDASRTAVSTVDPALEEMTRVFAFGRVRRVIHLWWPGAIQGILGGIRSAAGIVWKVTVAAEVLSSPAAGIGRQMGDARLFLETERVLAWTIVLILVAGVSDRLVQMLQARLVQRRGRRGDGEMDVSRPRDDGSNLTDATGFRGGVADALPERDRSSAASAVLELENISFGWEGHRLFHDLSLTFSEGEVTAVLGASGVGKSTLLALCAGAVAPSGGSVAFRRGGAGEEPVVPGGLAGRYRPGHRDGDAFPPRGTAARVGMVFQEPRLLPWRTAARNVALVMAPEKADTASRSGTEGVGALLERVGLGDVAGLYPGELSGGMQQRVALARALTHRPEILLVDEPLSGVDPHQRASLAGELRTAIAHHRALTIIASHDIELVLSLADRIIVLAGSPVRVARDIAIAPQEGRTGIPVTAEDLAALISETRTSL